jgi:hypothetical protein
MADKNNAPGPIMRVYRVFRVIVLLVLIAAILLVFRKSRPPVVSISPDAAATLQAKLEEEQKATDAKEPHALKLNEAELNSMLASNLKLAPAAPAPSTPSPPAPSPPASGAPSHPPPGFTIAPERPKDPTIQEVQSSVRDVKISLLEDRLLAYVVFAFHGQHLSLQLEGQLSVDDGYMRFTPSAGKLGSLPLPHLALDNAVKRLFDSPENKEKFRVPPEVSDIRVSGGELVVSYR